jgi:hypothetical protein
MLRLPRLRAARAFGVRAQSTRANVLDELEARGFVQAVTRWVVPTAAVEVELFYMTCPT